MTTIVRNYTSPSTTPPASPFNNILKRVLPERFVQLLGSETKDNTQDKKLDPPKFMPRPFFFAMPWRIRAQFEEFNRECDPKRSEAALAILEAEEQQEDLPKAAVSDVNKHHQVLPEIEFMRMVSQWNDLQPKREISSESDQKKSSIIDRLYRRFFPSPEIAELASKLDPSSYSTPPNIQLGRKVAIIGLHGWFPNKFLQKVIGDPRKTSNRMVSRMEIALKQACPVPPFLEGPPHVYSFPLHAEGTVEERVKSHFQELKKIPDSYISDGLTSLEHIRTADSIFIGAHSQGAPVSIILLSKLILEGIVDPSRQQVTLLTVAGIFHGPYPPLKNNLVVQYVEADAARQLFDLNDPESTVSKSLFSALDHVLQAGVSITCVSSWLDQVVPFYSACLLGVDHPNIWRCVYIDEEHYSPDFLSHLVTLGLKIKNLGIGIGEPETHMILSYISDWIAGSLLQHTTHSSAYRDQRPYQAALEWMTLGPKTSGIPVIPVDHVLQRPLQAVINPYYLPWLFRGWLHNQNLLQHPLISEELENLNQKFNEWQPESKALRDLKFKLEPITLLLKNKL